MLLTHVENACRNSSFRDVKMAENMTFKTSKYFKNESSDVRNQFTNFLMF